MAKSPLPVAADLRNYHLPIGGLGFLNQLIHFYVLILIICGQRPLSPWRPIQHPKYTTWLCCILMICIVAFDCDSLSHLHNWQHITSVVGNMILFLSFVGVTLGALHQPKPNGVTGPQADAVAVDERQEPHHSEDLEKCATLTEEPTTSPDTPNNWPLDADVVGVPENPANRTTVKQTPVVDTMSTSTTIRDDLPTPTPNPNKSESDLDNSALIFMVAFKGPPIIIIFAGIVGQLTQNLPSDWRHSHQIRSIVIAFSVLLGGTVLITVASNLISLMSSWRKTGEPKNRKWKDTVLLCIIFLSFFMVAFDKFLLAALAHDVSGARHIVSHGRVPLAYMIVTNVIPALAL